MTGACDPECAKWAESFGDCICSSSDLISFIAGLASVVFMGICFLPQIVINLKNGSSEGLSFIMVLVWSVGDACNIAGVFLTKALPTQVYMACLFAMLDLMLNFQHCTYTWWLVPRWNNRLLQQERSLALAGSQDSSELQLAEQPSMEPVTQPAVGRPQSRSSIHKYLNCFKIRQSESSSDLASALPAAHHLRSMSSGLMMIGCGMMTTSVPTIITAGVTGSLPGASDYRATSGAWGQDQFSMSRVLLSENGATAASGRGVSVGQALGWVMTATYMGARLPQLYKNRSRGTTEGLSLFMFLFLVLGSITYILSIFIRSTSSDFVVPKLPWLVEAFGSIVLDGSILCQILYYRYVNRQGSHTEPLSYSPSLSSAAA